MARKAAGKIDPKLQRAVDNLLTEVTVDKMVPSGNVDEKGKAIMVPRYTLTDVMKVIAAKTKLEAIRLKADDSGYGSGFDKDGEDD